MATVKVKFRESKVQGKEGVIYYQIIHDCVIRQIKTEYRLLDSEWKLLFLNTHNVSFYDTRNIYLNRIRECIRYELKHIQNLINQYDGYKYGVDNIIQLIEKSLHPITLYSFMQELIARFNNLGKLRTAETYSSTMNSIKIFLQGEDITFGMIDSNLLEQYEAFLKSKDSSLNTISFYMRTLRATYNRAVENGFTEQKHPFKRVYTKIEKTAKRAISLTHITKLKGLELTHHSHMAFARDIFIFSFYTRGMSFIDIAYLRKKDINNGELSYRRRKTGQRLIIKWEACMKEIAAKYPNNNNEYLFPIITDNNLCHRKQYLKGLSTINRHLKQMAQMIGMQCNLTMYVARHSWASAAKWKNIPVSIISQGMGHENEKTTQIYLASLDTSVIDNANKMILESV